MTNFQNEEEEGGVITKVKMQKNRGAGKAEKGRVDKVKEGKISNRKRL